MKHTIVIIFILGLLGWVACKRSYQPPQPLRPYVVLIDFAERPPVFSTGITHGRQMLSSYGEGWLVADHLLVKVDPNDIAKRQNKHQKEQAFKGVIKFTIPETATYDITLAYTQAPDYMPVDIVMDYKTRALRTHANRVEPEKISFKATLYKGENKLVFLLNPTYDLTLCGLDYLLVTQPQP